jgi:hypothetical protein
MSRARAVRERLKLGQLLGCRIYRVGVFSVLVAS